jgi:drug/metabolite transporter (DMT)-like permease
VTYVIPVVGVGLGAVFLGEAVGLAQAGGLILILAGVLVANGRSLRARGQPDAA